jgi:hypothetical protein
MKTLPRHRRGTSTPSQPPQVSADDLLRPRELAEFQTEDLIEELVRRGVIQPPGAALDSVDRGHWSAGQLPSPKEGTSAPSSPWVGDGGVSRMGRAGRSIRAGRG